MGYPVRFELINDICGGFNMISGSNEQLQQ